MLQFFHTLFTDGLYPYICYDITFMSIFKFHQRKEKRKMKKLGLILLAIIICVCAVFTACDKKDIPEEGKQDVNVIPENGEFESTDTSNTDSYNFEELCKRIEQTDAKGELDNEILVTVNGIPMSAAAVRYINHYIAMAGFDEAESKKQADEYFLTTAAIVALSEKYGVGISEEIYASNIEGAINQVESYYGDGYATSVQGASFTPYFNCYYTALQNLSSNIFSKITESADSEASKTVLDNALKAAKEGGEYVRAKHILIQFPEGEGENGELTDAQKAETLAKANEVLAKVNAMADYKEFDALITEYNQDPGMTSYAGGYVFTKGEMVPEFEESAFTLGEYETSGLVETTYGYHILLKLPIDEEGLENTSFFDSDLYMTAANDYYYGMLLEESKDYSITYADNYETRAAEFVQEYNDMVAEHEHAAAAE